MNNTNLNQDNKLGLRQGNYLFVVDIASVGTVAVPTIKEVANARVLEASPDGSIKVHWMSNYNLCGDFRSEVMAFDNNLVLDTEDQEKRNAWRVERGLMPIEN